MTSAASSQTDQTEEATVTTTATIATQTDTLGVLPYYNLLNLRSGLHASAFLCMRKYFLTDYIGA